jgi:hypothetical protein
MRTRTPLTAAQAAEVASNAGLPCSVRTWHRWLKCQPTGPQAVQSELLAITHQTPGGRKFWYRDEVEAFARSRCFTPAPPLEAVG